MELFASADPRLPAGFTGSAVIEGTQVWLRTGAPVWVGTPDDLTATVTHVAELPPGTLETAQLGSFVEDHPLLDHHQVAERVQAVAASRYATLSHNSEASPEPVTSTESVAPAWLLAIPPATGNPVLQYVPIPTRVVLSHPEIVVIGCALQPVSVAWIQRQTGAPWEDLEPAVTALVERGLISLTSAPVASIEVPELTSTAKPAPTRTLPPASVPPSPAAPPQTSVSPQVKINHEALRSRETTQADTKAESAQSSQSAPSVKSEPVPPQVTKPVAELQVKRAQMPATSVSSAAADTVPKPKISMAKRSSEMNQGGVRKTRSRLDRLSRMKDRLKELESRNDAQKREDMLTTGKSSHESRQADALLRLVKNIRKD